MTSIFRDAIGKYVHVYLDDVFIYSDLVEEHEKHLKTVFERLRDNQLYLKWKKFQLYAKEVECLGHMIDDNSIHMDTDKLDHIRQWRTPHNYNDMQ
jgi:RNA binding exosome subunit